jgi:hypothetical protein
MSQGKHKILANTKSEIARIKIVNQRMLKMTITN